MAMTRDQNMPVFIVTGLSGSGKSTAMKVLEDMGCLAVDGLPVDLLPDLAGIMKGLDREGYRGLALGMDLRQRAFLQDWDMAFSRIQAMGLCPTIIFIEAATETLLKRYAATRRPHPLENSDTGLEKAVEEEKKLLSGIKSSADLVIDTSNLSIHDLRRLIQEMWAEMLEDPAFLRIRLISFGFKHGIPPEADMVIDLRFLPNPFFVDALAPLTGLDASVADYVLAGPPGNDFMVKLKDFLLYLIPLYAKEGRYRFSVALGCTGGRHRSVAVTESLAWTLKSLGYSVSIEHRHKDRA